MGYLDKQLKKRERLSNMNSLKKDMKKLREGLVKIMTEYLKTNEEWIKLYEKCNPKKVLSKKEQQRLNWRKKSDTLEWSCSNCQLPIIECEICKFECFGNSVICYNPTEIAKTTIRNSIGNCIEHFCSLSCFELDWVIKKEIIEIKKGYWSGPTYDDVGIGLKHSNSFYGKEGKREILNNDNCGYNKYE